MKILAPLTEPVKEYEGIEREILSVFLRKIYFPLIEKFTSKTKLLKNSPHGLVDSLRSGRITYNRGIFSGYFNASISKELKSLGAKWDRKNKVWRILLSDLPTEIKYEISSSYSKFQEKISAIDKALSEIVPEEFAKEFHTEKWFDAAIYKTDRSVLQSLRAIMVSPTLTSEQRAKIAKEWQNNMDLWIKDFTEKEIKALRAKMQKSVFAGNRYETAISTIKKSYGVTANKAKFLARQETKLLTTKLKETRYISAGITKYKWKSVTGTPAHPVRPYHQELNKRSDKGEIFDFRYPPVDDPNGSRHNPGQNYNCRCVALPVITF